MNLEAIMDDLLGKIITNLSFEDVLALCGTSKKFRDFGKGVKPRQSLFWKSLIEKTFCKDPYYQDHLEQLQKKYCKEDNVGGNRKYNYLIWVQFMNLLDPITKAYVYTNQGREKDLDKLCPNGSRVRFGEWRQQVLNFLLNRPVPDDKVGWTIVTAARWGHLDVVKYLTEEKGEKYVDGSRHVSLRYAARCGHLKVVKYLVGKGIDCLFYTALADSVCDGHLDVVKYLVKQGSDINRFGGEVLRDAVIRGHFEVADFLIRSGGNIEVLIDVAPDQALELHNRGVEMHRYLNGI